MAYSVWQKFITDGGEQVVPSAVITVFFESSGAPATIYDGPAGASLGNTTISDITGLARFFAPAGVYKIVASKGAFSTEFRHVQLGDAASRDVGTTDIAHLLTVGDAIDRHPLRTEVGVADGLATLDSAGKVPASQLPSYVDDVLMFADAASFPVSGETGIIYVAEDTGVCYRWTGASYLKISDDDVLEFANLAAFPVSGSGATLYIAADTGLVYRWNGSAYAVVLSELFGVPNGVATLDGSGKVLESQIPRYLYANLAAFPADGAAGAIYIAQDTGKLYRWVSAGVYAELAPSPDEVQQYSNLAAFPGTGEAAALYIAADTGLVYRWDGAAYAATGLQPIASMTMLGNNTGGSAVPTALTKTQVQTLLDIGWVLQTRTTAAPNATVPAHAHTAAGTETNIDYVITPKGTGAILAQIPDNTTTGGNKRGTRAVDLQLSRTGATQVASGVNSVIGGGTENGASGQESVVGGGKGNRAGGSMSTVGGGTNNSATSTYATVGGGTGCSAGASGTVAGGVNNNASSTNAGFVGGGINGIASGEAATVAGGSSNSATGQRGFVGGGLSNLASGAHSVVSGGDDNTASGANSTVSGGRISTASGASSVVIGGDNNTADAAYSVASGWSSHTRGRIGAVVFSSGNVTTNADVQRAEMVLRGQTTDGTAKVLTSDNAAPASTNIYSLATFQTAIIKGVVLGRNVAALADHAAWEFTAVINKNDTNATTALTAAVTPTLVSSGGTGGTWVLAVTADTTNGGLLVTVTGEAAKTVTWGCRVIGLEVQDNS